MDNVDSEVEGLCNCTVCTLPLYPYSRSSYAFSFLNTAKAAQIFLKLNWRTGGIQWLCEELANPHLSQVSWYSACIISLTKCLRAFFLKDYCSSFKTTNRLHRSSLSTGKLFCTTRTPTVLLKFKWNCHERERDIYRYIHILWNFRNSHLLFGLNVWFVL